MDESNFDRLLERYATGQVTREEKIKIEAWLEVRKTRGEEKTTLTDKEEEELFSKITATIDNEKEIRALRPQQALRQSRTRWTLGIAASVLILVAVGYALRSSLVQGNEVEASEKMMLEDGSIVWLRGNSTFSYSKAEDGTRQGTLDGEALFEIAKDPSRPFQITYKGFTVTVLGTSFNLRLTRDSLDLQVLTGKVRVTTSTDSSGVVVEPMQTLKLTGTHSVRSFLTDQSIDDIVEGTQYNMKFENSEMKAVADKLSAKFDVRFEFSNAKIENCMITADFTDRSLESTTEMLSDVLNAKFTRNGSTIHIEGSGCN